MQKIIANEEVSENTPILMKVIQAGENLYLSPLLDNNEIDNNSEHNHFDYFNKIMEF
jgi:hypothetical protein